MSAIVVIVLLVLAGSVVAYYKLKSGEVARFESTATPRQITMSAAGIVGTKRGWTVLSQGDGSANFSYTRGANKLLLVFFFLFFIIPGIVYWILSGKKEALSVNTEESGPGMTIVQVSSNGWRGKFAGRALRSQLGLAPGSAAALAAPTGPAQLDQGQAGAELPIGESEVSRTRLA